MSRLKSVRRKTLVLNEKDLAGERLFAGASLPLVIEPKSPDLNLPKWIGDNRADLRAKLHKHGALLFRGFKVTEIPVFEAAIEALSGELLRYLERSSPRHAVKGNVYTSTDYPPNEIIFPHTEQSYNMRWCGKISFYCKQAPAPGMGQTPIADTRKIYARVDPALRERLEREGYIYMRNFGDGLGLNWPEVFQTRDRDKVEAYCRENHIEWEWKENDRLRTWQLRPAVRRHPETGEKVWFNHLTFFHLTTAPARIRNYLADEFSERDLPNQTFFADFSPIPDETVAHLRECYLAEKVLFDWQEGDVMAIDNMLAAHAREAFEGPRQILTAMSEPTRNDTETLAIGS